MYCDKCGNKIEQGQEFCGKCGKKIKSTIPKTEFNINASETAQKFISKIKEKTENTIKNFKKLKISYQIAIIIAIISIILIIGTVYMIHNASLGIFTEKNYSKVKLGMSYSEVKKLIGPCHETDYSFISYGDIGRTWYYNLKSSYRGVYLVFENDKLTSKPKYVTVEEFKKRNTNNDYIQKQSTVNLTGIEQAIQDGMIGEDYITEGVSEDKLKFAFTDGNLQMYYDNWEDCLADAKKLNIITSNEEYLTMEEVLDKENGIK